MKIFKKLGLSKEERLCSRKVTDELFGTSTSLFHHPIRIVYQIGERDSIEPPAQILFSVPRKKIKKAVHRNLVRRRMREAYRLNKELLYSTLSNRPIQIRLALLYVSSDVYDFSKIQDAIVFALRSLSQKIESL